MDRKTLLAFVLMAIVIVVTPRFFSSPRTPQSSADSATAGPGSDSAAHSTAVAASAGTATTSPTVAAGANGAPAPARLVAAPRVIAPESASLATAKAQLSLVSPGAVPSSVGFAAFRDLRAGRHETVSIEQPSGPLLHFRLAEGRDTVALDTVPFTVTKSGSTVTFASTAPAVTISYATTNDDYVTQVHGSAAGAPAGSALLIDLPNAFRSVEADTTDDERHFAYGYKQRHRDVNSVLFSKLDTLVRADTGAMQWVSARSKYWIVAVMTPQPAASPATQSAPGDGPAEFRDIAMRRDTLVHRLAPRASAVTMLPLSGGQFTFDMYIGPQTWTDLRALGNDLENVNQYGSFLRPVVQPFVTICMRIMLWLKTTSHASYGWVLVIFSVLIRILIWPLYQRSMRTSIQMQRLQPELTEIQKRYKSEPDKHREAMMALYQSHGMSPLSPLLGCLPMLLPMPVIYALYFVFQNTIEFRGVPFLWLPDLSLRDPYYIIPLIMGASMFLLSWIGMRAAPPNPQTKVMSYMMPVVFTAMFANLSSGLNLYYAISNLTSVPQQWWIARERLKAGLSTPSAKKTG